jgi:hypothetical protein
MRATAPPRHRGRLPTQPRSAGLARWSSAIPAEGMEHLWSPAGATSGNRWQMGRPRKPLKQADPQPVATHGNRFAEHGKEDVYHRLPPVADDPLLVREGVDFLPSQRDRFPRTRRPAGLVSDTNSSRVPRVRRSGALLCTTRRARVWSSARGAAAGPIFALANSGSGLAARLGLTERPRPRARIKRLDGFAGWADRDESRVLPLRSDDDPTTVRDGR